MPLNARATEEILLDCLHAEGDRDEAARLAALDDDSAAELAALADRQQVAALLYHRLRTRQLESSAPPVLMERLKQAHGDCTGRNMRLYSELRQIASALHAKQIAFILLKGAFLAEAVYRNIAVRPMVDIDILVARDDLEKAADALTGRRYAAAAAQSVMGHPLDSKHLPKFVRDGAAAAVELHWSIHDPCERYAVATAELFERSIPASVAGIAVRRLCPEDLLLHLCIHMAHQDEFKMGLRPVCDVVATVLHYADALNWDCVSERAARWGVGRGVYLSLLVAKEMLGARVPQEALDRLAAGRREESLLPVVRERLFIPPVPQVISSPTRPFLHVLSRKGLQPKLQAVVEQARLDRQSLAAANGIGPGSPRIYFCYLHRCYDLLKRYSPLARKFVRKGDPSLRLMWLSATIHRWLVEEE